MELTNIKTKWVRNPAGRIAGVPGEIQNAHLSKKCWRCHRLNQFVPVAYPGILFGEGSTNSVEDRGQRERGSWGGSPLVSGSGDSCNLVQEISFHIVKFS